MISTVRHHSWNQSGCYSGLSQIFAVTSESARPSKLHLVSFLADQQDPGQSGAQIESGIPDKVPASDNCKKVESYAEQPSFLTAYKLERSKWSPETSAFSSESIAMSVGTASIRGSLSPSEEDTDSDSPLGIRKVKSERIWRSRAHSDHLERLQEFQIAVEIHPGKLSHQIMFDRFEQHMRARALARRKSKESREQRASASSKFISEPVHCRLRPKRVTPRKEDDVDSSGDLSQ
eukprot:TRINITY_DN10867_c0_g1_i2.p1 TRINITY_DN10867_c0_g1~~TRINITY_DN10867_c0_g1_i2.p1  ORF type:complete len:234 (+),score=33.50 TRINITY_DN10867_c0_g1_i2:155-856(+)